MEARREWEEGEERVVLRCSALRRSWWAMVASWAEREVWRAVDVLRKGGVVLLVEEVLVEVLALDAEGLGGRRAEVVDVDEVG